MKLIIYTIASATRTTIQDELSDTVGQLGTQGSSRNKSRSFLNLGVPNPFHEDMMRKLLVAGKQGSATYQWRDPSPSHFTEV